MRQPSVTPATRAAASTTGFTRPSAAGGVTSAISRTPATRAGTAVMSTVDGYAARPHPGEDGVDGGRDFRRHLRGRTLEGGDDGVHTKRASVERADHRATARRARMSSMSRVTAACSVFIEARLTIIRAVERVI